MEFQGMIGGYPVNRLLTEQEQNDRLEVKKSQDVEPHYQLSVIGLNSTYMECVDKFFIWKGVISTVCLCGIIFATMILFVSEALFVRNIIHGDALVDTLPYMAYVFVIDCAVIALGSWFLSKESFRLTHFPIRFNRKNRMVYAFRLDGTILSAAWDELFFTLGRQPRGSGMGWWEVRAHVLAKDGTTVLESFALPFSASRAEKMLLSQWEFVRRYMEEGPSELIDQVEHVMKVSERRETFWMGFHRLMAETKGGHVIIVLALVPFFFLVSIGRQFAKWTSEIPVWPKEVEETCAIDPNDPWVKE